VKFLVLTFLTLAIPQSHPQSVPGRSWILAQDRPSTGGMAPGTQGGVNKSKSQPAAQPTIRAPNDVPPPPPTGPVDPDNLGGAARLPTGPGPMPAAR
jgi:hypothetical protein